LISVDRTPVEKQLTFLRRKLRQQQLLGPSSDRRPPVVFKGVVRDGKHNETVRSARSVDRGTITNGPCGSFSA